MTGRLLPPGLHAFDTLLTGDHFDTPTLRITPEVIRAFADLTWDHFEIHLSDAGAQAHGFAAQVAHGLLVLSLVEGLKSNAPVQLGGFAALGWDWQFARPVLAGDTIRARVTVLNRRNAGPRSGMLTLGLEVLNQHNQCVQKGQTRVMAHRIAG
ncbi:MAG: MaoC family dehydratase [Candidatus Saccharibacteria bacterium]|nr:MaoC family dehydratase [Pseudorhodobacter sp.]